jgi:hypothetical protein
MVRVGGIDSFPNFNINFVYFKISRGSEIVPHLHGISALGATGSAMGASRAVKRSTWARLR